MRSSIACNTTSGSVICGKCPLFCAMTCSPSGDSRASSCWCIRFAATAAGEFSQPLGDRPPVTTRTGTWATSLKFERTRGTYTYRIRARVFRDSSYPYETGVSRPVRLTIRGN